MAKKDDGIPAWMIAQALVIKAKNVLTEEAIDVLYKEIEEKRMAVDGKFMPMELEKSGEMEQGLFLIRHLMDEREELERTFGEFISAAERNPEKPDAATARRIEEAKKFLIAVAKIDTLTRYGMVFDSWFSDASSLIEERDPASILAKTAGGRSSARAEALDYLITSGLLRDGVFTKEELDFIDRAEALITQ